MPAIIHRSIRPAMRAFFPTLVCSILVVSCSTSGGPERDSLQVQVFGEAEEIAVYEALVTAFEKQNPDIDVQLIPVSDKDDHLAKLTTSFSNGTPLDAWLINFREYSQYVARGAVDAIGPYLDEHGVDSNDYFDQPMEAFTYDGELQCMPQNISSLVVYYNAQLLERAGLKRPSADWDWDEFRRYATVLTRGEVRGLGIEPSIIGIASSGRTEAS
jgi:multiple sugar transport system substrate-binding protein